MESSTKSPTKMRERLEIVKELTALFKFERMVYLSITIISLIILLIAIVSLLMKGEAGSVELTLMFGSSGLISYTASRLLHMWDQALKRIVPDKNDKE